MDVILSFCDTSMISLLRFQGRQQQPFHVRHTPVLCQRREDLTVNRDHRPAQALQQAILEVRAAVEHAWRVMEIVKRPISLNDDVTLRNQSVHAHEMTNELLAVRVSQSELAR